MHSTIILKRILRAALVTVALGTVACAPASAADAPATATYIVVLTGDPLATADDAARLRSVASALVAKHGGTIERVYGSALNGFAVRLTRAQAKAMAADDRVRYVEADAAVRTQSGK